MKTAYENFKKDCSTLDFNKSDVVTVKIELKNFDLKMFRKQIDKLIKNSKEVSEMSYLINFLEETYKFIDKAEKNKQRYFDSELFRGSFEIDLNKLKYCKTILCYFHTEYAEGLLNGIDYIQDQLSDYYHIDRERIYYFPPDILIN